MGIRLEVLKWEDQSNGTQIVQRMPPSGMADLKLGARVLVNEGQAAIFYRDGRALDVLRSGSHTLSTQNVPILSSFFKLVYNDAPFQSCVYFVSLKPFLNLGWGTTEPILLRDSDFGLVRIRAFGKFSVRVAEPQVFVTNVVGTSAGETSEGVERWFRVVINDAVNEILPQMMAGKSVLDVQTRQRDIAAAVKARTSDDFGKYGVELVDFKVISINVPEDVQKAADKAGSMRALKTHGGSLGEFMQYQTANAIEQGGGTGVGTGMQLGMLGFMPGMMAPAFAQPGYGMPAQGMMQPQAMAPGMAPPPLPGAAPPVVFYAAIGGQQQGPLDGNALRAHAAQGAVTRETLVWRPGMAAWTRAADVPEVAMIFGPPPLPAGAAPAVAAPPPLPS